MAFASLFSMAKARVADNEDDSGSTAIDPCVWSAGAVPKSRKVREGVRDFALLPARLSLWGESWSPAPQLVVRAEDVSV